MKHVDTFDSIVYLQKRGNIWNRNNSGRNGSKIEIYSIYSNFKRAMCQVESSKEYIKGVPGNFSQN